MILYGLQFFYEASCTCKAELSEVAAFQAEYGSLLMTVGVSRWPGFGAFENRGIFRSPISALNGTWIVIPRRAAPRALLGLLLQRDDRAVVHFALEDFVGAAVDLRSLIRAD